MESERMVFQIGNSFISSDMTKTQIEEFLEEHPEIYSEYLPEKLGSVPLYMKSQKGLYKVDITIEFEGENITSIEKNTHQFHIFKVKF